MTTWLEAISNTVMRIKRSIPLLNARIPEHLIFPIVSICLGYKVDGKWKLGDIAFGRDKTDSLFRNGVFFFRFIFSPVWTVGVIAAYIAIGIVAWFGFGHQIEYSHLAMTYAAGFWGLGIRWAGDNPTAKEYAQTYAGPKLNGEWALIPRFRVQSDLSAAEGTTGANYGQAIGFNEGNK